MSITCMKGGTLATIQDLGRSGHQNLGIIVSGAMDTHALKIANIIVGNNEEEACIEITMRGTSFLFQQDTLIAITGGDLRPMVNNINIPQWRPVLIKANSIVKFKGNITGLRSYLSVSGGYDIQKKLGSKSTYLRAEFGGYNGRAFEQDDVIHVNQFSLKHQEIQKTLEKETADFKTTTWHVRPIFYGRNKKVNTIRFIEGNEYTWFSEEAHTYLEKEIFKIENSSDRMGYRLMGKPLHKKTQKEMISEAIINGTVQISNDGNPIVLLADRQTTGGYPRIAQIITADIYKFGQLKPNDKIKFKKITLEEAYIALYELQQQLLKITLIIKLKYI